jgi:hypothetical protein
MAKIKEETWGWVVEDGPGSWATIMYDASKSVWVNWNTGEPVADDDHGKPRVDSEGNGVLSGQPPGDDPPKEVDPYKGGSPVPGGPDKTPDDQPPTVAPGVDPNKKKFTKVEPQDLVRIANVLDTLVQPLTNYSTDLEGINIKAGHFTQAKNIKQLIGGHHIQGGLVETYVTNIGNVVGGFRAMITALNKMAKLYKNADDMSKGNANDVQNILSGVVSAMGGNAPTSIPGYQPPDDDKGDK